ncbi:MAG: isoamylase early set domain-containing protein [Deltaproteobacteria bacterium]|nr:isoamylase early set domain-containing protein [Deltaproteobacteria bacterium]MBW2640544.1 isoamylase early set domain-containing protein [Deltaproteobacteria bacterium]MBW2681721.1 isoamylase early set domain-containing protein [Deltaproteobacteria bacterium]
MSVKKSESKLKRRKVIFSLESPDAKEVILMGDFNQWNPKKHPMKKDVNGVWKKATLLLPGRYEYRFLVDNQWENDPENNQTCLNRFGSKNNFIVVPST